MDAPVPIPTALIYPSEIGRPVIKAHVAMLAESLTALGLRSPITVRRAVRVRDGVDADVFEIVAGRHRYEAAQALRRVLPPQVVEHMMNLAAQREQPVHRILDEALSAIRGGPVEA